MQQGGTISKKLSDLAIKPLGGTYGYPKIPHQKWAPQHAPPRSYRATDFYFYGYVVKIVRFEFFAQIDRFFSNIRLQNLHNVGMTMYQHQKKLQSICKCDQLAIWKSDLLLYHSKPSEVNSRLPAKPLDFLTLYGADAWSDQWLG